MKLNSFSFGIYPGGQLGTPSGMTDGPPDNAVQILKALDILQGEHKTLMVRCYVIYKGKANPTTSSNENPQQFAIHGRQLDLVLCFQSFEEDLNGWINFIRYMIGEYHPYIGKLQITEEANVNLPVLDGHYPASRAALVAGIVSAHQVLKTMNLQIPVGFNATPDFNPNSQFWKEIASLANQSFYEALGFVGLDFFPDVFRPLPGADNEIVLEESIRYIISLYRNDMKQAGIGHAIPIHVTENGWPTGEGRSEEQQAERLDKIILTIFKLRKELNITHYELFALRDANSSMTDIFYKFGIMNDDYTPKKLFLFLRN